VGRNTGKIYALGETVWVEVKKADVIRKQLDYAFVSNPEGKNENSTKKSKRK
jgi:exoribonuclease R